MTTLPEYLASLPSGFGYELRDCHVVAAALSGDGRPGPRLACDWQAANELDPDAAKHLAKHLARMVKGTPEYDRLMVVGYGPEGDKRATLLREAITKSTDLRTPIAIQINDGTWRAQVVRDVWTPALPLPDVSAEQVLEGRLAPAATREELAVRYAPSPHPTFGAVTDADAAVFASSPPSFRAEVAIAHLDKLVQPALDDPYHMAIVAHLTTASPNAVRDAVLLAAAADREHAAALVRVYQGAPEQMRSSLAATAGTALFLTGGGSVEVDAVLAQTNPRGEGAHLAMLVTMSKTFGFNPHELRANMAPLIKPGLDEADARWTASLSSTSFPTPGSTSTRESTGLPRRTPRPYGKGAQTER